MLGVWAEFKLQALVYDILPSRKGPESEAELKLQALVYDILPSRKGPESDAGSVG